MEKLASLKPLHPEIDGFSITAGDASGVNDGAAAMVVADRALAEAAGLEPLAVGRPGVPDDCAGAAVYLCSELGSYVTGVTLPVDGGTWASGGWTRGPEPGTWQLFPS